MLSDSAHTLHVLYAAWHRTHGELLQSVAFSSEVMVRSQTDPGALMQAQPPSVMLMMCWHTLQALAQATGRKEAIIKKEYEESGDLGVVAAQSRATQRTMFAQAALTIAGVFKTFKDIATAGGANSQERKRGLISKLLVASKGNEPGYIMRSLQVRV